MRLRLALLIAVTLCDTLAAQQHSVGKEPSGLQKVLHSMFPSAKPKVVVQKSKPKPRRKHPQQTPTPAPPAYQSVDPEWMARYWEEEAAWDYYIPEDDQIKFVDGKYVVPTLVYRHFEDMAATPHRR